MLELPLAMVEGLLKRLDMIRTRPELRENSGLSPDPYRTDFAKTDLTLELQKLV